jgi:DNA-binding MarR family transcriptional regulator
MLLSRSFPASSLSLASAATPHPIFWCMMRSRKPTEPAASPEKQEPAVRQDLMLSLVGYNCRRAYLSIIPYFQKRMAKHELRPVDFTVLSLIKANPNITQKRLAAAAKVSPPNLAPLLDRLEARGIVVRQRNPLDKRSQTLALTREGMSLSAKAEKTAVTLETEATAALTEEERAELIRLLQKIFMT